MAPRSRSANGRAVRGQAVRGQTSIDFLIGVAVFMLAVAFVFAAVPNMLDPFSEAQEDPLVADRVSAQISGGMLAKPGEPGALNETCTEAFFDISGDGAGCPLPFTAGDPLTTQLAIDDSYRVNVTVQRNVSGGAAADILCWDGGIVDCPLGSRLAIGDSPPTSTGSVTSARRTVFLDGRDVTLVVRLW